MEITYELELDYGPDGPLQGEHPPSEEDMAQAVTSGLEELGFSSVDVKVTRQ